MVAARGFRTAMSLFVVPRSSPRTATNVAILLSPGGARLRFGGLFFHVF